MAVLYIIYILVFFISILVGGVFINAMLHSRYPQKIVLLLWCVYSFLDSCCKLIPMHFSHTEGLYILFSLVVMLTMTIILYKEIFWKKVVAVVIIMVAAIVADALGAFAIKMINPPILNYISGVSVNSILMGIFGTIILILVTTSAMGVWAIISNKTLMKNFLVMLLLPISQGLFMLNVYVDTYSHAENFSFFVILAELVGLVFDVYWIYELVNRSRYAEAEALVNELRVTMETEKAHYAQIEEKREVVAQIRHDLKNQLNAARILTEKGQHVQAVQILDSITEKLSQTNEYPYCGIPIINAVISDKEEDCKRNQILLDVDLHFPEELPLDYVILCSVFSNLLDNAVHAATSYHGKDRWIKLRGTYEGGMLAVKVINTSNPPEKPREGHGTGTRILNHLAEMHNGSYKYEYKNGEFTALIILEVENENSHM